MTVLSPTRDPRPVWLRALVAVGALLLLLVGGVMSLVGAAVLAQPQGPGLLCFGLVLLALGVGGVVREANDVTSRRNPPAPRLEELGPGEPALHLPRAAGPALVSVWATVTLAVGCALGAVAALVAGRPVFAVVLLVAAAGLVWVAQPHRAAEQAGGLWCSPGRLVHQHVGVRWEVSWDDIAGVTPTEPMQVLVHPGREPEVVRTAAAGRFRGRPLAHGMLAVETRYLPGGATLASYVVGKAAVDPQFRADLGTPASLPPETA